MNRSRAILLAAVAAAVAVWMVAAFWGGDDLLTVTFLDVGEGLCSVIITPSGKTLVMDCGTSSWRKSDTIGEKLTAHYLQKHGVDTIDVAVLSHPHEDHVSGYAGLLRVKPAELVLDIGMPHPTDGYQQFLAQVDKSEARYMTARRGQVLDMGDGVKVEVLNPDPDTTYSDLNNQSAVLRVTYGSTAFLLAADAEEEAERDILEAGLDVRSQVLQVGHHGSVSSSSMEWLDAVGPEAAVISCGRRNRYGHPHREVIKRLDSAGVRTYRTDQHGAVECTTDGSTIRIKTYRHGR